MCVAPLGPRRVQTVDMPTSVSPEPPAPTQGDPGVEPFKGLFDRSSEAVIMFDDHGAIVDGNPAALALFDTSWNTFITRDVRSYVVATTLMPDPEASWQSFLATGDWAGPIRIRRDDGTTRDADMRALAHITPGRHMAVLRDETDRRATELSLIASEERLRLLAERSHDVIYKYRVTPTPGFEYVSPSLESVTGYSPAELYADPSIAFRMLHPDDEAEFRARARDGRLYETPITVRWIRKDGTTMWAEQTNIRTLDADGRLVAVEGVGRDITARVEAAQHLASSEARFRTALEGIRLHAVMLDLDGNILFMNRYSAERLGLETAEVIGRSIFDVTLPPDVRAAQREAFGLAVSLGTIAERWQNEWMTARGERVAIDWSSSFIRDADGSIVGMASVGEDVTARQEAEAMQRRLLGAIDQAAESIIVTDADRRILYANPAFERSSGFSAADVEGRALSALLGGPRRQAAARRLNRRMDTGQVWTGSWELVRHDGGSYHEEVTISPVRDAHGTVSSYVAVARDVAQIRAMQEALDTTARERSVVAAALARLDACATPEATAQSICDAMLELPGIDVAAISWFDGDDVSLLGLTAPDGFPVPAGGLLPRGRGAYLQERARHGPWVDSWSARDEDGDYGRAMTQMGLRGAAYAPIGGVDSPVGLVVIGTTSGLAAGRIHEQVPAAIEFAVACRTLLGGPMASRRSEAVARRRIASIVAETAFRPVFQPIVDMASGRPIGFEALTRFEDGTPPDATFNEAVAVGLGHDLEEATLAMAIEASWDLPAGPWLSLNVSAAFVLDGDRLATIMRKRTRPIILEVTEHVAIDDYEAVRVAIAALGPDVRIAVDDAGAGVANFTHIVNLRPDFVKIDASLIRDVNADLTRQALIVGLLHFARATNCWIIAEGVETEAERVTLGDLDIAFGQGYLFGRPAAVAAWEAPVAPINVHAMPGADGPGSRPGAVAFRRIGA
jgi:PAS domain S-box-containing protein